MVKVAKVVKENNRKYWQYWQYIAAYYILITALWIAVTYFQNHVATLQKVSFW